MKLQMLVSIAGVLEEICGQIHGLNSINESLLK